MSTRRHGKSFITDCGVLFYELSFCSLPRRSQAPTTPPSLRRLLNNRNKNSTQETSSIGQIPLASNSHDASAAVTRAMVMSGQVCVSKPEKLYINNSDKYFEGNMGSSTDFVLEEKTPPYHRTSQSEFLQQVADKLAGNVYFLFARIVWYPGCHSSPLQPFVLNVVIHHFPPHKRLLTFEQHLVLRFSQSGVGFHISRTIHSSAIQPFRKHVYMCVNGFWVQAAVEEWFKLVSIKFGGYSSCILAYSWGENMYRKAVDMIWKFNVKSSVTTSI